MHFVAFAVHSIIHLCSDFQTWRVGIIYVKMSVISNSYNEVEIPLTREGSNISILYR